MSEQSRFVSYDYKEFTVEISKASFYLDSYACFGWELDTNVTRREILGKKTIALKRDRKILNKMELTRLERNFEACMEDISALEDSKANLAITVSVTIGIVGTAFMAGSVFAVTADPPIIWLCAALAVPGFIGWLLPRFAFKRLVAKKTKAVRPLIEEKYDEAYLVCEKGNALLGK